MVRCDTGESDQDFLSKVAHLTAELEPMIDEQITAAIGASSLFVQDAITNRWHLVTDKEEIDALPPGRYIRVFTKDPSVQAFALLLDRALDKPRRQEREVRVSGEVDVVHRLMAARRAGSVGEK
jgi:hypothetical protein